ncbi:PAS domain-containing sensor histidine kinase [Neolewinella litorea]|uniref:Sensor protein FixL n=1 Tax=Neolewinella litorea TaxID=2562452 RepID=A0A4V3XLC5_9BACT|nr:PAS domain-containing sensor histidine kinase [Neolewinella litorea]THH40303.1 PAS domain S-box protein [Neolewinella litorea]
MSQDDGRRLKALFEMATDGIITMNDRGIMENVNRAACELFGYTAEELRGQKVNMLMSSHDRTHHDEYLERYQRTRVPHIIGIGREVTGRCKDGREFPLRLAVSEVTLAEGTVYTGILHDLSEFHLAKKRVDDLNRSLESKVIERTAALRAREAELQRALGKERELNELKSRFLTLASHEFKTPLSTVLSSAELIELYTDTGQQPKRQGHLNRIKEAVGQLTEILNDFLSLSQLEQGVIRPEVRKVHLDSVLSTAIEASEGQLKPGQVIEVTGLDGDTLITTDPKLLRRILINLLSNAAKYSPPDSPLYVRASLLEGELLLEVEDHGIGIPLEDQVHLFDRFFRARNVENIKGTGLGLNIVAQYVELLGGSLNYTSREGEGTTFSIRLPNTDN